jgi:hypothetical protein
MPTSMLEAGNLYLEAAGIEPAPGRAHGFAEDYGHADLILGRRAPDEIFLLAGTFLSAHASRV